MPIYGGAPCNTMTDWTPPPEGGSGGSGGTAGSGGVDLEPDAAPDVGADVSEAGDEGTLDATSNDAFNGGASYGGSPTRGISSPRDAGDASDGG